MVFPICSRNVIRIIYTLIRNTVKTVHNRICFCKIDCKNIFHFDFRYYILNLFCAPLSSLIKSSTGYSTNLVDGNRRRIKIISVKSTAIITSLEYCNQYKSTDRTYLWILTMPHTLLSTTLLTASPYSTN